MSKHITYADAGVDVDEGARAVEAIRGAVAKTTRPEVIGGLGGFGSCFSAAALKNMDEPVLVSGTDGVGTKLAIAQMLDDHGSVGEDLVAMCADDVVVAGAEPLFFLDYVAVGKLRSDAMAEIVGGIAHGCELAGCALVGGEMAEHPGVMAPDDYDLAGFVVGVVDRKNMLGSQRVREGDVVLGIPSSGIHSNGYSLVRKVVIEGKTVDDLRRPLDELGGESLAEAVLRPTTIYAGSLIRALHDGAPIHALAHITGGGITENLNRALPVGLDAVVYRGESDDAVGDVEWDVPPIITYVCKEAQLTMDEAYKTFNMGVGMSVICSATDETHVRKSLAAEGLATFRMGEIVLGEAGRPSEVVYRQR